MHKRGFNGGGNGYPIVRRGRCVGIAFLGFLGDAVAVDAFLPIPEKKHAHIPVEGLFVIAVNKGRPGPDVFDTATKVFAGQATDGSEPGRVFSLYQAQFVEHLSADPIRLLHIFPGYVAVADGFVPISGKK